MMHDESPQVKLRKHPPQRIGVEPRSPPTEFLLFDGMSPNDNTDEDDFISMTWVSSPFPELVSPPTSKNPLPVNINYYFLLT